MSKPKLSIVLGTLDRPQSFNRLYETVEQYTTVPWEMIVMDAGQQPVVKELYPKAIVLEEKPRLGHVKGYNVGFRETQGEWVCWLNDDAEVTPGWAANAIDLMEANENVGLGAFAFCNHNSPFHVERYQGMPYANFGILSKKFGDRIGWFDEECCGFYGGDNSLAFRTYLAGMTVLPLLDCRIIHKPYNDSYRKDNEARQPQDASNLMKKYGPYLDAMKRTYHMLEHTLIYER